MNIYIYIGNCLETLQKMDDQSVNTCITSPPYWGLRDYNGEEEQLGLEDTPELFVDNLVKVFREVKRVLKDDGTVWLNLGDSYAMRSIRGGNKKFSGNVGSHNHYEKSIKKGKRNIPNGLKPKDLIGIPWRVALALQADGWYLRQDIIWHKPNPMPESVRDRCTKAHEYIFLLSKNVKYYFDNEAIKENSVDYEKTKKRYEKPFMAGEKHESGGYSKDGAKHTKGMKKFDGKRNKRSVWTVTTKPFKGAHFATFPMDLIEPCVLAGCPEGGTVLDPFGGSGTTAIVANKHNRNAVLCELNEEYVDIAKERIVNTLGMMSEIREIR